MKPLSYTDSFLHLLYGEPQERPLCVPVTVDLSLLPVEERLALAEAEAAELRAELERVARTIPILGGMEGR